MTNKPIETREISLSGRFLKIGRLRHEWCDFLDNPEAFISELRGRSKRPNVFTFVTEIEDRDTTLSYHRETFGVAVLPISTFDKWWDDIGFKARNKVRKAAKSGIEVRVVQLDDALAEGVERIYGETKVKQGRRFLHYGKKAQEIKLELSSFLNKCVLVGAYDAGDLVGFMKLYEGKDVLRTVHIISTVKHRERCIMDALIAKAVDLCAGKGIRHLQYGSWTGGGVGVFREKHGFQRLEVPRYFVPLTLMGRIMLGLNLHRPVRDRLPKSWTRRLVMVRTKWNSWRFGHSKQLVDPNPTGSR